MNGALVNSSRHSKNPKQKIRFSDQFFFWADRFLKWAELQVGEASLLIHPLFRLDAKAAKVFIEAFSFLSKPQSGSLRWVFLPLKYILGLPFLAFSFLILITATLSVGSIATIFGLRNLADYSFKEQLGAWVLPALLLCLAPFVLGDFQLQWLNDVLTFSILLVGIDFLFGHCGIPTLGHAGFVTSGGFLTAWFYEGAFGFKLPFMLAVGAAGSAGALLGALLAFPAARIKDYHLTVVTLTFGLLIPMVLKSKYLGGYSGVSLGGLAIKQPEALVFFKYMRPQAMNYFIILLFFAAMLLFAHNLIRRSQVGRSFHVVKCDVEVAGALGISAFRFKVLAFSLSAFYSSIAGGLFILKSSFVSADLYGVQESILFIVAIIFGGAGSILGSVVGSLLLTFEPLCGRWLTAFFPRGNQLAYALTGSLMIVMIYFAPRGISGLVASVMAEKLLFKKRRGHSFLTPPPDYNLIEARGLPSVASQLEKFSNE